VNESGPPIGGPLPGARVRVRGGNLCGATGVLVRITDDNKWLLKLDGVADGVLLLMPATALRTVSDEQSAPPK